MKTERKENESKKINKYEFLSNLGKSILNSELVDNLKRIEENKGASPAYLSSNIPPIDFTHLDEEKKIKRDREIKDSKNIESIAKSNNEILLSSKEVILLMSSIQTQLVIDSENEMEFNRKILELTKEFKDLIENDRDGGRLSSFLGKLSGDIASAVIIQYVKSKIGL